MVRESDPRVIKISFKGPKTTILKDADYPKKKKGDSFTFLRTLVTEIFQFYFLNFVLKKKSEKRQIPA